jgi:hypothetical protein
MLSQNTKRLEMSSYPVAAQPRVAALMGLGGRLERASRYGFAPDMEHGPHAIGDIYQAADVDTLEATVLVSFLDLGQGACLLTVGRWCEGFLDLAQVVSAPDVENKNLHIVLELLSGAGQVLGLTTSDQARLQLWLLSQGEQALALELGRCARLPLSRDREDLLQQETRELGLIREDLAQAGEVRRVFSLARHGGDIEALRRIWEAGRADLLTATALLHQRWLTTA